MIPSTDVRLASMIRAMEDVILPALAGHSGLALEQASILLGHLHVLRQQADDATAFERSEARHLTSLARDLVEQAEGGEATTDAAKALEGVLSGPEPSRAKDVRSFTETLSVAIEALVAASGQDGGDAFKASSADAILRSGREQSLRDRSWFAAMGFEHADAVLPPFDELEGSRAEPAGPA